MRTLWLLIACACRGPTPPPNEQPPAPAPADALPHPGAPTAIPRAAPADAAPLMAADAAADAGGGDGAPATATGTPSAGAATATHVALTINGAAGELRYGYAGYDRDGMRIALFVGPVDCKTRSRFTTDPPEAGARLLIVVPAGPGNQFYAGHPIGREVYVEDPGTLQHIGSLPALPTQLSISAASTALSIQPTRWKAGARIRGTIEGAEVMLIGAAAVNGAFDVELCDDVDDATPRMRATAPAGPARGRIGRSTLAPRTVQAIVRHRPDSPDAAIDVAVRHAHGALRQIWMLTFYAEANVACPPAGKDYDPATPPMLRIQAPGGTGAEHPLTGAQPASAILRKGSDEFGAVWPAWVQLDKPAYEPGAKLRGALWAEAPTFEDDKGQFGGRFEATVCDVELAP